MNSIVSSKGLYIADTPNHGKLRFVQKESVPHDCLLHL